MLNYIRAELYRNFNRMYFWCMTGIVAAFALMMNIMLKTSSAFPMNFGMLFELGAKGFILPVFIVSMIIEMVTAEEQKNQTFKNVVSFGFSRNQLILSKLFVSVILSIISAIIILAVYFGSGAIMFEIGKDFSLSLVGNFMMRLLAAVPLWIGAISIGTLLAIVFKNNTTFAFVYAGLFLVSRKIIELLIILVSAKFEYVYKYLITIQLVNLGKEIVTGHDLLCAALLGIVYAIIFTILSMRCFKNTEVK